MKPSRPIRSLRQLDGLSKSSRRTYDAGREVTRHARSRGIGVSEAIDDLQPYGIRTTLPSVEKYWGDALGKDSRGRVMVVRGDRNAVVMQAPTAEGVRDLVVTGNRRRSVVGEHQAAVNHYRRGDGESRLVAWEALHGGETFRGTDGHRYRLTTDPDVLDQLEPLLPDGPYRWDL